MSEEVNPTLFVNLMWLGCFIVCGIFVYWRVIRWWTKPKSSEYTGGNFVFLLGVLLLVLYGAIKTVKWMWFN